MGLLDNIGDQVAKHGDKIDEAIEKGGDFIDSKTGNKYEEQVDQAQDFLKDKVDELGKGGEAAAGQ